MQKFVPQSLVRISWNGRSRSTQLGPKLMFSCVSFCLGTFGKIMLLHKLDAKRAKLVQLMPKFMPRCLVRNFHNEHSRSTPLEPKLMFCCVYFHLGAFGTVLLLHETWCKTRQTGAINAKVCAMMSFWIFRNKRSRSTPLDPKLMFWCVSSRLSAFGTVFYCTKLGAKYANMVQLMQKFVQWCLVRIFCNECS